MRIQTGSSSITRAPEGLPSMAEIEAMSERWRAANEVGNQSTYHSSLNRLSPRHKGVVFTRGCDNEQHQLASANRQAYKWRKHASAIRRGIGLDINQAEGGYKHRRQLHYWAQRTAGGSLLVTSGAIKGDAPPGGVDLSRGEESERGSPENKME